MSEQTYRWFSAIAGAVAGAVCVVGFVGLVYRRITNVRVRRTTSRTDLLVYFLLVVLIGLGTYMTFGHNLITKSPYDYRDSVSEWWRSLFVFQPDVDAVRDANAVYQIHAIIAWAFWALVCCDWRSTFVRALASDAREAAKLASACRTWMRMSVASSSPARSPAFTRWPVSSFSVARRPAIFGLTATMSAFTKASLVEA